jgi:hypothetical protein
VAGAVEGRAVSGVWRVTAEEAHALAEAAFAIHDALFDRDEVRYDPGRGLLVIPFQQEGWPSGPAPQQELVRATWRFRDYRIALFHGELRVHHVLSLPERAGDWGDNGRLDALAVDTARREVRIEAAGAFLAVPVARLEVEVEVSGDVAGHLRRRIGRFTGFQSDAPYSSSRS